MTDHKEVAPWTQAGLSSCKIDEFQVMMGKEKVSGSTRLISMVMELEYQLAITSNSETEHLSKDWCNTRCLTHSSSSSRMAKLQLRPQRGQILNISSLRHSKRLELSAQSRCRASQLQPTGSFSVSRTSLTASLSPPTHQHTKLISII